MTRTPKGPNPHEQALAKPTSRAKAVRAKCWDCQGRGADAAWQRHVRECTVTICPLWHIRPYRERPESILDSTDHA